VRVCACLLAACAVSWGCRAPQSSPVPLPQTSVTDDRYRGLVFLVGTVKRAGTDFIITNDSTQPWFDVTIALMSDDGDEFRQHLDEIDAGQSVTARRDRFETSSGRPFNSARISPRTLVVSAEIGEGGPSGVYAVRL
jgi:hypothetical protein